MQGCGPGRKKKRTSRKPTTLQTAVIAKYSAGQTKTKIAEDLDISRNTVHTILNQDDITQYVLDGRARAVQLIPKSLDVAEYKLDKKDGTMAIAILRGTQVLRTTENIQVTNNNYALLLGQLKQEPSETPAETAPKQLPEPPKP